GTGRRGGRTRGGGPPPLWEPQGDRLVHGQPYPQGAPQERRPSRADLGGHHPSSAPRVAVGNRYTLVRAVQKRTLPASPHPRFAGSSGSRIRPSTSPLGRHTHTPPGPVQNTWPWRSTFMPSGTPGSSDAMVTRMRLFVNVPSARTSKARMCLWAESSMYRIDSSGEKARPLGSA